MHRVRTLLVLVASAGISACVVAPREGVHSASPADAAYASTMTARELAKAREHETVYGWDLEIAGERARFFACSEEHACTDRVVEVPAKSVVAVKRVGRVHPTRADGSKLDEADVLSLTLAGDVSTSRGGVAADPQRGLTVGTTKR